MISRVPIFDLVLTVLVTINSYVYGEDEPCNKDSPFRYQVLKGDCLFQLAAGTGTSVNQWLASNPRITDENFIQVGWILCAPVGAEVVETDTRCSGRRTASQDDNLIVQIPPQPAVTSNNVADGQFKFGNNNQQQKPTTVTVRPVTRRTAPRTTTVLVTTEAPDTGDTDTDDSHAKTRFTFFGGGTDQGVPITHNQPVVGPLAPVVQAPDGGSASGKVKPNPGPVFPLENPGLQTSRRNTSEATPSSSSDGPPPASQVIQLPASATAEDAPPATRPPFNQPRVQQKPLMKSQPDATGTATGSTPATTGTLDPNIVQCQFFDSGFLNCLRGCTVDEFQWDIDTATGTKIMMRQCIENKPPAVHAWLSDDGILAQWMKPKLIRAGQAERIIAACVFSRDRSFSCQSTVKCDTRLQSVSGGCTVGSRWKGKTTEGDPLKQGTVLKGSISAMSEDGQQDAIQKRQVIQVRKRRAATGKGAAKPKSSSASSASCGKTTKVCLLMRDALLQEPVQTTCYTQNSDGTLQRIVQPTIQTNPPFSDIASKMAGAALQRSECRFFGADDRFACKGYTGDFCSKQGQQDKDSDPVMYNECFLTDAWSSATAASCPDEVSPYIRTCILQKGWASDVLTAATCYEKQGGPNSSNSALARLPEFPLTSLQSIVDVTNARKVIRAECDFIGSSYYCTGYTASYCDSQWENKIQSNYWDCHASVWWNGTFTLDSAGAITITTS
ncbi:hypothetical protein BV898_02815 [Hypsibius exemplaris]|uniref:LysM domain-containing protein n=1 Tax=Hypsibius exemplaris TaxID=2072580 RepID=A0A1W0X749_HYPEX|nr:hypothetical protein BV898_02815 [Hypsibius exemplaris]